MMGLIMFPAPTMTTQYMAKAAMIRYTGTPATTRLLAVKEMTVWKAVMEMIPTSGT